MMCTAHLSDMNPFFLPSTNFFTYFWINLEMYLYPIANVMFATHLSDMNPFSLPSVIQTVNTCIFLHAYVLCAKHICQCFMFVFARSDVYLHISQPGNFQFQTEMIKI